MIESYVLGVADPADVAELQRLSLQHPEIAEAIRECELWLEANFRAEGEAIPVSGDVRQRILAALGSESTSTERRSGNISPAGKLRYSRVSRYLAAASLVLLMISLGVNLHLYNKYKKAVSDYSSLLGERGLMLAENKVYQAKLISLDSSIRLMSDPAVVKIGMSGVPGKENNSATLFWSKTSKNVYLITNNLPPAPAGKQYQLWALVDGKPVDAGVLQDCSGLCQLKPVERAQAFAITLEKAGGSPAPTLEQMYVIGNVAS